MAYGLDIADSPPPGVKRKPNETREVLFSFYFPSGGLFGCLRARTTLTNFYGGRNFDVPATSSVLNKERLLEFIADLYDDHPNYRDECLASLRALRDDGWYEVTAWEL